MHLVYTRRLVYRKLIKYCRCGYLTVGCSQRVTVVLSFCFIEKGECVTVEVFMLCDLTMLSIFSFLMSFIMSLGGYDQVSTAICKNNII